MNPSLISTEDSDAIEAAFKRHFRMLTRKAQEELLTALRDVFAGADKLPDEFTIDGLEEWERQGKGNFNTYDSLRRALNVIWSRNGLLNNAMLYTQVDSDKSDDRVYAKGNRLVNRTGTWAVLFPRKEAPLQ
jgi:hypothetical protein